MENKSIARSIYDNLVASNFAVVWIGLGVLLLGWLIRRIDKKYK